MNRKKCTVCGVVNTDTDNHCRRCGASLISESGQQVRVVSEPVQRRSVLTRLSWITGTTLLLLSIGYISLLLTSEKLSYDRAEIVDKAIAVLREKGFRKQVFVLNSLVRYRATDNWWNRYVGHHDAYAATNFPFEVVTLYPEFFDNTKDDVERASILLHESSHLFGSGEEGALESVWRSKQQLGWTEESYRQTKVWKNTRELTQRLVPALFTCGADQKSDCTP